MPTTGTPLWHRAPHRLPWKSNPWRAWLAWGSWFTSQPLRSHQAGVTLEDNEGRCQCWQCHRVPHLPPHHPQSPPGTFWPLGPTTQISPGRPCQERRGVRAPVAGPPCLGDTQGVSRGCPGPTQLYSHHAQGAPACPAVPRHPSRPSGPAGRTDVTCGVTHGVTQAIQVGPGASATIPGVPAAMPGPTGGLDSPSAPQCQLAPGVPARRKGDKVGAQGVPAGPGWAPPAPFVPTQS